MLHLQRLSRQSKNIGWETTNGCEISRNIKKNCSFADWLKLVDSLQPHMNKHGLKLIFVTESADGKSIYDVGEAETMEGVEAFISDPEVINFYLRS